MTDSKYVYNAMLIIWISATHLYLLFIESSQQIHYENDSNIARLLLYILQENTILVFILQNFNSVLYLQFLR